MNKHAYLIIAHNEFYILEKLIKLLDDERNDIFLHIDKKVKNFDFDKFKKMVKKSNLYFTKRIDVVWASSSQIQCELIMLDESTKQNKYLYYHLLSGVDLPLKNQNEIHNFFNTSRDKEFVHFSSHQPINGNTLDRVKYYHYFLKNLRNKNKLISLLSEKMHTLLVKIQVLFKIDRVKRNEKKYFFGANWFSITDDLARYVVKNKKQILKEYKFTKCADEVFLQTLVMNSNFKNKLYNKNSQDYNQIVRAVDWKRGTPYTYKEEDYEELINSDMLFARKFSTNIDKVIIDKIYMNLR